MACIHRPSMKRTMGVWFKSTHLKIIPLRRCTIDDESASYVERCDCSLFAFIIDHIQDVRFRW